MQKLLEYLKHPEDVLMGLSRRRLLDWMPDKLFLKIVYFFSFHKRLNLKNPATYNEKLQWMKLYDRNPLYTELVDKRRAKEIVAEIIGEEHIIPTLGVWQRAEDIDFDSLPDQFVLKCNHDSGGIVICRDKNTLDRKAAVEKLSRCLKQNGYWYGREWPYKNVQPCIIAEKYMEDSTTHDLRDYKFSTFSGKAKLVLVATERFKEGTETKLDYFDENFEHISLLWGHPNAAVMPPKPSCFEQMKELAEKLAEGLYHVRVDFFEVDGRVYFGELTFFDSCGLQPFNDMYWDELLGSWLELPLKNSDIEACK